MSATAQKAVNLAGSPVQPIDALSGALLMAARGFPIFRLKPNSKEPYTSGIHEATTDPKIIRDWVIFDDPKVNFGMAMGHGHVGIDCDAYKPGGQKDRADLGEIPPTTRVSTPQGGEHVVLKSRDVGQQKLAPTIDVRSKGGYLVCVGSIVDGKRYLFNDDALAAPCPPHIDARLGVRAEKEPGKRGKDWVAGSSGDWESRLPQDLKDAMEVQPAEGQRSDYSFGIMCRLFERGLTHDEVLEASEGAPFSIKFHDRLGEEIARVYARWRHAAGNPHNVHEEIPPAPDSGQPTATDPAGLLEFARDVSLADILAYRANALVRGLLHPDEDAVLYGVPGAGKSFVAVDLNWHLALGKDWHGLKVKRRVPTLYVCLEGVPGFRARMVACAKVHGDPGDYFARLTVPISLVKEAEGEKGLQTIIAAALELGRRAGEPCGLVTVDTLARAVPGADENSTQDMMAFVQKRLAALRQAVGCGTLTVHHPNAKGELRGSTSLRGAFDAVLHIDREKNAARRALSSEKVKDGTEGPLFDFELVPFTLGQNDDGKPETTCTIRTMAPAPAKKDAGRPKEMSGAEKTFRAAFGAAPTTRVGNALRAALADVRKAFVTTYIAGAENAESGEETKRRTWNRFLQKTLPPEFVLDIVDGVEVVSTSCTDF